MKIIKQLIKITLFKPLNYFYNVILYVFKRRKRNIRLQDMLCICRGIEYKVVLEYDHNLIIKCNNCGLSRNYPMPKMTVCGEKYQILNENMPLHYHQKYLLKQILRIVGNRRSEVKILDIGCSTGNMMMQLKKDGCMHVYGIELDDYAYQVAKRKGLSVYNDELNKIVFPFLFDIVYLNHVLEHISDVAEYLKCIKSIMARTGYMIIGVPNIESICARRADWIGKQFDQHVWQFTPATLGNVLNKQGFEVLFEKCLSSRIYDYLGIKGDCLIVVSNRHG